MKRHLYLLSALVFSLTACGTADAPTLGAQASDAPAEVPVSAPPAPDAAADPDTDPTQVAGDGAAETSTGVALTAEADKLVRSLADVAQRRDEQLFHTIATESGTLFGIASETDASSYFSTVAEADGTDLWEVVDLLLATTPALDDSGTRYVFPAAATGHADAADWDEIVATGLYTPGEVERIQASEEGYVGWRLAITTDGELDSIIVGD